MVSHTKSVELAVLQFRLNILKIDMAFYVERNPQ